MSSIQIFVNFIFILIVLFSLFSLYKFELEDSDKTLSGKILKSSALTVGFVFLIWYLNWFKNLLIRYISYNSF